MAPKQTDPQFKLRIPADLKARIEKKAAVNNRSLSSEILNTLEDRYPAPVDLEEVANDIRQSIRFLKTPFAGESMFRHLADELYDLMYQISRNERVPPQVRDAALKTFEELTEQRSERPWAPDYNLPDDF